MPSPISQPQEFVWTWNIFVNIALIIVILPAVGTLIVSSIKRHINKRDQERDKKDEKIAQLLAEKEAMKEGVIHEWRDRFSGTLCDVINKVDEIADGLHSKVPFGVCDDREREMKRLISGLDERLRRVGK